MLVELSHEEIKIIIDFGDNMRTMDSAENEFYKMISLIDEELTELSEIDLDDCAACKL